MINHKDRPVQKPKVCGKVTIVSVPINIAYILAHAKAAARVMIPSAASSLTCSHTLEKFDFRLVAAVLCVGQHHCMRISWVCSYIASLVVPSAAECTISSLDSVSQHYYETWKGLGNAWVFHARSSQTAIRAATETL